MEELLPEYWVLKEITQSENSFMIFCYCKLENVIK